ncbi:hypothetical protein Q7P37_002431 [Cladosporium fusiforme]
MPEGKVEPLDSDTAPSAQSVWEGINRRKLYQQIQTLTNNHVAGRQCYTESSSKDGDDLYPLSLEVERSLVDDLAFVAAHKAQADSVSAVAVEQGGGSLLFRLAANEGVSSPVKEWFDRLFETLRAHARKEISQSVCQEELFEQIVRLNRNKILGRLGSELFEPPPHLPSTWRPRPLPIRLRSLLREVQQASEYRKVQEIETLDDQNSNFEEAFGNLESGSSRQAIRKLQKAIKEAYALTENGVKLPERFKAVGYTDQPTDAKAVRDVGKVANYWRISRHLSICSRRFRSQFQNAQWCPVPKFKASSTPSSLPRRFVHAEIQILVHYELTSQLLIPRVIGVSKEACFLCDSFIRAHGQFAVSGAHRQMFHAWTVPDLQEYTPQSVLRIRTALGQICADVNGEFLRSQKPHQRQPFPNQSAINLNVIHFATPSNSTLPTVHDPSGGGRAASSETIVPASNSRRREQASPDVISQIPEDGCGTEHGSTSTIEDHKRGRNKQRSDLEVPVNVTIEESASGCSSWLDLSATFLSSTTDQSGAKRSGGFGSGSVSLQATSETNCQRIVYVADIPFKGGLTIERDPGGAANELSFVLVGDGSHEIQVNCQWHI